MVHPPETARVSSKLVFMHLTQNTTPAELAPARVPKHGVDWYLYVLGLEPAAWPDKTVKVPKVSQFDDAGAVGCRVREVEEVERTLTSRETRI
jgi:hypothetical protein